MQVVRLTHAMLAIALSVGASGVAPASEQAPAAQHDPQQQPMVRVSRLVGREIADPQGNTLGEIEDYALLESGQAFAVVSIGGFLGIAEREVMIPQHAIRVSPSVPELLVYDGDPSALQHAPRLDSSRDTLDAAARERALVLRAREEHQDVQEAERVLERARARLRDERSELSAARDAMRSLARD